MYFAVLILLMKRSSNHRSFFLILKCIALHIGELSDCAVWFPSSGENLAFIYFLSSTCVEDGKKTAKEQNSLVHVWGFSSII